MQLSPRLRDHGQHLVLPYDAPSITARGVNTRAGLLPGGGAIDDSPIRAAKAALRSRQLAARATLSTDQRNAASSRICTRLETLPELAGRRTVLAYAAFGSEVALDPFLTVLIAEGRGVFLPWVEGEHLGIARVVDLEGDLVPGYRGIREPKAIGRLPARPDRVDAAVVPGVAFDRRGVRLGYGGGHFDRLLATLRRDAPVIGVAFDAQVVEALPREPHDRCVDVLVTETRTMRTA